jgi:hypothetical protein
LLLRSVDVPPRGHRGPAKHIHGGLDRTDARKASGDDARGHKVTRQRILGGAGLIAVALACTFGVLTNFARQYLSDVQPPHALSTTDAGEPSASAPQGKLSAALRSAAYDRLSTALKSAAYEKLSAALNNYVRRFTAANNYDFVFDIGYLGVPPATFVKTVALVADDGELPVSALSQSAAQKAPEVLSSVPRNGHRADETAASPTSLVRSPRIVNASPRDGAHASGAAAEAPARPPTIWEKLFGKPYQLALAYAAPGDASLGDGASPTSGRYDRWTAVYDISAHTVYMPDGTRLEAHSGLGSRLDDPRYVDEKNRGATPPNLYDLEPREDLFHGVRALRLIPADNDKVFGRSGLLAHSYLLGPNGDSNGCVSFRDYNAFLRAYTSHTIKRLAVVARLD